MGIHVTPDQSNYVKIPMLPLASSQPPGHSITLLSLHLKVESPEIMQFITHIPYPLDPGGVSTYYFRMSNRHFTTVPIYVKLYIPVSIGIGNVCACV